MANLKGSKSNSNKIFNISITLFIIVFILSIVISIATLVFVFLLGRNVLRYLDLQIETKKVEIQERVSPFSDSVLNLYKVDENYVVVDVEEIEVPELQLESIGIYKTTAYCPCKKCCGNYSYEVTGRMNSTSSGTTPISKHTIAADIKVLPYGTKVMIDDIIYVVEDTGSAVNGKVIDIYFDTHEEALQYGLQQKEIFIVKE